MKGNPKKEEKKTKEKPKKSEAGSSNNDNNKPEPKEEPKLLLEVKKVGDLSSEVRAAFMRISKPIDSQEYVDMLNDLVVMFFAQGKMNIKHLMAIVRYFKVFNLKSSEAAVTTLEEGLNKAKKEDIKRFKEAKPYLDKVDALTYVKEVIELFKPYDDKIKTAANWARIPVLVENANMIFNSARTYVIPDGRALIMTKFMWNVVNFAEAYDLLAWRLMLCGKVMAFAKTKLGGCVKKEPKSVSGGVTIESAYYDFPSIKAKYIELADGEDPVPAGIAEDTIADMFEEGKIEITIDNFATAKAGCIIPSVTHLLMTKDYRVAKSPSGAAEKGSAQLIKEVKKKTAGLMMSVIKMFDKSYAKPAAIDLDPKKNGELRTKYWECYKMLTTTMRQMDYALYGKRGGANTRADMTVKGDLEVVDIGFSFE